MKFYLGTHHEAWLGRLDNVPLFVSHRRLMGRKTLPRAKGGWALDSGAFTELSQYGEWRTTPKEYVTAVRRYRDEVGGMEWAAPQDWMCEPHILAKTGGTVRGHQVRTVTNYLELRHMAPDLPFVPVLQGWTQDDYMRCVGAYAQAGVDLTDEALVGLGTVCRRQATQEIEDIVVRLAAEGLKLHGFGVKVRGLARYANALASADSLAWSFQARRSPPLEGCVGHINCANCVKYALQWRDRVVEAITC